MIDSSKLKTIAYGSLDWVYVGAVTSTGLVGLIWIPILFGKFSPSTAEIGGAIASVGLIFFPALVIYRLVKFANMNRGLSFYNRCIYVSWAFACFASFIGFSASEYTLFGLKDMTQNGQPIYDPFMSIYFSIVTITTLGYGDLVPYDKYGRAAACWEALSGYLMFALFIAALIRVFQTQALKNQNQGD